MQSTRDTLLGWHGALPSYEEELAEAQREGTRLGGRIGAALLLSFVLLDLVVVPHAWAELLALRIVCGASMWLVGSLTARGVVPAAMGLAAIVALVMVPIEWGALRGDGGRSAYLYAAMLPLAGAPILVPLRPAQAIGIGLEVLALVYVPLAVDGRLAGSLPTASFLVCMLLLSVVGAYVADALRRREYAGRLELVRQAQLANLGLLAAGLAHELAGPLTVARLEAERLDDRSPGAGRLNTALERMRALLDAMRGNARLPDRERRLLSFADEVKAALLLVQAQLRQRVVLESALATAGRVVGQPTLLGQVVTNLVLNAAAALEGRSDGRIRVRLVEGDGRVVLEVEDNGPGVPTELRERIFEPQFSTKGQGGNGLGLWLCTQIAEVHEGTLTHHDVPGGGALFRLSLPASEGTAARTA